MLNYSKKILVIIIVYSLSFINTLFAADFVTSIQNFATLAPNLQITSTDIQNVYMKKVPSEHVKSADKYHAHFKNNEDVNSIIRRYVIDKAPQKIQWLMKNPEIRNKLNIIARYLLSRLDNSIDKTMSVLEYLFALEEADLIAKFNRYKSPKKFVDAIMSDITAANIQKLRLDYNVVALEISI